MNEGDEWTSNSETRNYLKICSEGGVRLLKECYADMDGRRTLKVLTSSQECGIKMGIF